MLTLSLACDHRAVDGACAARFLEALGRHLSIFENSNGDFLGESGISRSE
jgi:pyruvate/2-oxoglutarate dehydrogenase complex dihydrolipoamide acyltransferase (E2) component